jgi:hypothetical protein
MKTLRRFASLLLLSSLLAVAALAEPTSNATPPRLSLIEGEVSFWRPGAEDWSAAQLNTPLAEGDVLYAGGGSKFELQIGGRAFVRAGGESELTLLNRDPDFLQFRVGDGQVSFDLRVLPAGVSIEVDTPHAAVTVDRAGYYRFNVDQDTTRVIARRGGRATVVPAGGPAVDLGTSKQALVEGHTAALATLSAPAPDQWDAWNYARSERVTEAQSERYLPPDVYGAVELDHAGRWRIVAGYGRIWVPADRDPDWAPYTTGHWIWDPYYGWTWIDDAPWGWAPFHYGRWVFVDGFWGWAPGPAVRRAVYSPALVAFFSSHGDVSIGLGVGAVSWVALSWGEPLLPWWGQAGFVGVPYWGGWGGPRVVNNVVVDRRTVVNVTNITFRNARAPNAVTVVPHEHFGRGRVRDAALPGPAPGDWRPVAGRLPVAPAPASLTAGPASHLKPRREVLARPVVTIRQPREIRHADEAARLASPGERRDEHRDGDHERIEQTAPAVGQGRAPEWSPRPDETGGRRRDESMRHVRPGESVGSPERRNPNARPRPAHTEAADEAKHAEPAQQHDPTVPAEHTGRPSREVVPFPRPTRPAERPQPATVTRPGEDTFATPTRPPHVRENARPIPDDARDARREQRSPREVRPASERDTDGWTAPRREPPRQAAPSATHEPRQEATPQRPFDAEPRPSREVDEKAQKKRRRDEDDAPNGRGSRQGSGSDRSPFGREAERR